MARKIKKVILIASGAITGVVCAVIISLLFNIQALKPRIEAAASKALGMDVRIKGRLGIALFPGIGISLREISVMNAGADFATVEKMNIGLEFIALTRREVRISRVGFIHPVFSLVRHKNGTYNFEKKDRALPGKPFAVEKISISQGTLTHTDAKTGKRIEARGFDGALQNLLYGGKPGVKAVENISFDGDMRCKTFLIGKVSVRNLVMRTTAGNGIADITAASMNVFGGEGKGSIHVDVTEVPPRYGLVAALNRFKIEELIQAFSSGAMIPKSMEGTVNFTANITATGKSAAELTGSLNGGLSLNGEDLSLTAIDIDALIPKYERSQNFNLVDVGAYFLAGPFGPVLTKSYNFASMYTESRVEKRSITRLVSVWKVQNGIATAIDAAFATKKYRLAMKGGLNFNNDQFADVTVAVLDKRGCAVYSQKVRGPFGKPQVEKASIFQSITGSVSNALEDARKFVQREKCEVFYSGSVAQPGG